MRRFLPAAAAVLAVLAASSAARERPAMEEGRRLRELSKSMDLEAERMRPWVSELELLTASYARAPDLEDAAARRSGLTRSISDGDRKLGRMLDEHKTLRKDLDTAHVLRSLVDIRRRGRKTLDPASVQSSLNAAKAYSRTTAWQDHVHDVLGADREAFLSARAARKAARRELLLMMLALCLVGLADLAAAGVLVKRTLAAMPRVLPPPELPRLPEEDLGAGAPAGPPLPVPELPGPAPAEPPSMPASPGDRLLSGKEAAPAASRAAAEEGPPPTAERAVRRAERTGMFAGYMTSFGIVLVGSLTIVSISMSQVGLAPSRGELLAQLASTKSFLIGVTSLVFVSCFAGGFVLGSMTPRRPYPKAVLAGAALVLTGAAVSLALSVPAWYAAVVHIFVIPAFLFGTALQRDSKFSFVSKAQEKPEAAA